MRTSRNSRIRDLAGERFGRWLVLGYADVRSGHARWQCLCDCGTKKVVVGGTLTSGASRSCGCARLAAQTTHGMTGTRTYRIWKDMIRRCYNRSIPCFRNYGGRGIRVRTCWVFFENFLADMGVAPDGMTLERINNDGDYSRHNCRWANRKEQANNRRDTVRLTVNGVTRTLTEWSEVTGINQNTLYYRLRRGAHEAAVLAPVEGK